jgi:hypothetical protein
MIALERSVVGSDRNYIFVGLCDWQEFNLTRSPTFEVFVGGLTFSVFYDNPLSLIAQFLNFGFYRVCFVNL